MMKRILAVLICAVSMVLGISSCSKDDSTSAPPQTSATLKANTASVVLGGTQSVTISGGTPAYFISSQPNIALAAARLDSANRDTAFLVIAPVATATGSTAVTVKDNSSPQRQVSILISKP